VTFEAQSNAMSGMSSVSGPVRLAPLRMLTRPQEASYCGSGCWPTFWGLPPGVTGYLVLAALIQDGAAND
jgi:hypothetical protein